MARVFVLEYFDVYARRIGTVAVSHYTVRVSHTNVNGSHSMDTYRKSMPFV